MLTRSSLLPLISDQIKMARSTAGSLTEVSKLSAQCGAQAARKCKGYKGMPDGKMPLGTITVWYCGAKCQKTNWGKHKRFCKDSENRRRVYRAAGLAQEVFYIFSRVTSK